MYFSHGLSIADVLEPWYSAQGQMFLSHVIQRYEKEWCMAQFIEIMIYSYTKATWTFVIAHNLYDLCMVKKQTNKKKQIHSTPIYEA